MKVCLASVSPKVGNKKRNIRKMEKVVSGHDADLFVFGEMSVTGYVCRDAVFSLAEPVDGESVGALRDAARDSGSAVVFGMPVKVREGMVHNAAVLAQPENVGMYFKSFLPNFGPFEEKRYFTEGADLPVFQTPSGTVGLCICYDLFFPELVKGLVLNGADLVVCISASPATTRVYFEQVLPTRAIENTAYIAYANLVGEQQGLTFWGGCQCYAPKGDLLARAEYFKEDVIVCDLDFDLLQEARIGRPTLRDTRAELFLDVYRCARGKQVFSDDVKAGIALGEKLRIAAAAVREVEIYGSDDVAYGVRLSFPFENITVHRSDTVRAVLKGTDNTLEFTP
jgi:predicted amidohydrolase